MTDETEKENERETVDEETTAEDDLAWADEGGDEFAWADDEGDDDLAWADEGDDDLAWADADDGADDLAWVDDEEMDGDTDMEPFPAPADDTDSPDTSGDQDPLAAPDDGEEGSELAGSEMDEAFDDMAVDDVETDEVWSDVTEGDDESLPAETAPADERVDGASIAEVSKHDYCESCEYFSEAPEIHCTHDGTEILDFLDMETVRLSDCPIVAERKGLEGEGVAKGSASISEMGQD
jgi:hypothetical protein